MNEKLAAPLRDYLLGTTYRKDALQGALWNKLRNQLAGGDNATAEEAHRAPRSTGEGRGIALLDDCKRFGKLPENVEPGTKLSMILHGAAGIVRWEPVNPNPEHRACPSPGGRFTVDVEVACCSEEAVRWFRYLPREHMLVAIAERCEQYPGDSRDIIITLRGNLGRCAVPYGDLAYCLVTIELGAVLAQTAMMLGVVELSAESITSTNYDRTGNPALYTRVRAPSLAAWLAHAPSEPAILIETVREQPDKVGGILSRGLRKFAVTQRLATDLSLFPHGLSVAGDGDVLRAIAVRSSGLDLSATPVGRPAKAQLKALLDTICRLHADFAGLAMLPFRMDVRFEEPQPTDWAAVERGYPTWLHVRWVSSPDSSPGYAHPVGAVIVTISADLHDYTARTGAAAVFAMHLAAGIATQIICTAAACAALACRPMRSFDHAVADAALPVECWSLIQLVIYDDQAPNPAFQALAPGWKDRS